MTTADINKLTKSLQTKFADRAIYLGTVNGLPAGEVVSSGSLLLDQALGTGGLPKGRLIELYGPESSGKTSVAVMLAASIQTEDPEAVVAYIDLEQTFDKVWAANLGLNNERCILVQPPNFEAAVDITKYLAEQGVAAIIFDSVAAGVTTAEAAGDAADAHVGIKARIMGKFTSSLLPILRKTGGICIFLNQVRQKVGVMYGNPNTTPGGMALKYNASIRLELYSKQAKEGNDPIGLTIQVKMVKNKVAPPFRKCELTLLFDSGFDRTNELVEIGKQLGLFTVAGASHTIEFGSDKGKKLIGRAKLLAHLAEFPVVRDELHAEVSRRLQQLDLSMTPEEMEQAKKDAE
jgi:recombination protein RecA